MSDFWCPLPWIHQFVQSDGIKTCCQGTQIEQTTVSNFTNSKLVKEVKAHILENKVHKNCTGCASLESKGFPSTRTSAVDHYRDYTALNIPDKTEYLDLRYSNLCNFSCRTCEPAFSSSIANEIVTSPSVSKWYNINVKRNSFELVSNDLAKLLPGIKRINFTGGEPLLIKDNLLILDQITDPDCEILITTNASVINPAWMKVLEKFNRVHWTISIDGVGDFAEYIRFGTKWDQVDKNIRHIINTSHSVAFNTVLSAYSVLDIDNLVEYFITLKKQTTNPLEQWFAICEHPSYLSPNALPGELQEIAKQKLKKAIKQLGTVQDIMHVKDTLLSTLNLLNTSGDVEKFIKFTEETDAVRNQDFDNLLKGI